MDISFLFPGVQVLRQTQYPQQLTLYLGSTITAASCPTCQTSSTRVHGNFWRYPRDLSWAGQSLRVWLRVRRFDCLHPTCSRATFCESFAQWLLPYAHRTQRLKGVQAQIGVQIGGEVGALILGIQGNPGSATTILRAVKALELPEQYSPRVLGVDDWAFKKGRVYGTLLVDLERHQVIDLLQTAVPRLCRLGSRNTLVSRSSRETAIVTTAEPSARPLPKPCRSRIVFTCSRI